MRREGSGEREIQREAERQTETGGREEEEGVGQVPPFKGMGAQRHTADQSTVCLPGPQGVGPDVPGCQHFSLFYLLKKMRSQAGRIGK